jgi:hypothetical protein
MIARAMPFQRGFETRRSRNQPNEVAEQISQGSVRYTVPSPEPTQ